MLTRVLSVDLKNAVYMVRRSYSGSFLVEKWMSSRRQRIPIMSIKFYIFYPLMISSRCYLDVRLSATQVIAVITITF